MNDKSEPVRTTANPWVVWVALSIGISLWPAMILETNYASLNFLVILLSNIFAWGLIIGAAMLFMRRKKPKSSAGSQS